jgi:hypothetical protein
MSVKAMSKAQLKREKEIARWEKEKAKPKKNFYFIYLIFVIALIYATDEIASQIGTLMKTEIANDLFDSDKAAGLLDMLSFRIGYNGIGKIYWNEDNSVCENFYSLMNASIYAHKGILSLELWSKNLTNTNYNTFYFVSVGNAFFSQGRPAEFGVTLSLHL